MEKTKTPKETIQNFPWSTLDTIYFLRVWFYPPYAILHEFPLLGTPELKVILTSGPYWICLLVCQTGFPSTEDVQKKWLTLFQAQ